MSKKCNGKESCKIRQDLKARTKTQTFYIESPNQQNLQLSMNFSTSSSSSPNLKVSFSGNDYQSWIDIVVLYHKVVKDISSLFDIEYLHRTIHLSNDSGTYSIMNTLPNGGDQVLVFIADNPINHAWKPLDMVITGRSYQIYEPLDHTVHFNGNPKLILL